ncbi:hypothetical protein [Thioflexithrix psekupsensis]|uniref:hypothetical protein n=1 Tax=Thioflexithrix psekupsensis TaxID=1570016 RepID=UPI00111F5B14|nr:hypothetical protein [Thioflexithrix psekupsensis]
METEMSYFQGWDVGESNIILIHAKPITRPLKSAQDLNAHLKIMPGEKVTAHIDELSYLYEWTSESGTRFFTEERPNWYANRHYPSYKESIPTRVYGEYGVKIDDTDFEQQLIKDERLYHIEKQKIEQQQAEMQAKINAGKIELGMDMLLVNAILGIPKLFGHDASGKTEYRYKKGEQQYTVQFKDNVVIDFKPIADETNAADVQNDNPNAAAPLPLPIKRGD